MNMASVTFTDAIGSLGGGRRRTVEFDPTVDFLWPFIMNQISKKVGDSVTNLLEVNSSVSVANVGI